MKDAKGRDTAGSMSDRAIAVETLQRLRAVCDVLEALGSSPMAGMLPPGMVPSMSGIGHTYGDE